MRVVLFACLVWQGQNYHVLIIQRNSHWKTVLPISCATLARICENIFPHTSDRFAFFADRTKGWNWSWECSIVVTQAWPAINHSSNIIQSMKQLKKWIKSSNPLGRGGCLCVLVPLCTTPIVYKSEATSPHQQCKRGIDDTPEWEHWKYKGLIPSCAVQQQCSACGSMELYYCSMEWFMPTPFRAITFCVCLTLAITTAASLPHCNCTTNIDLYLYCVTLILSLRPGHTGPSAQWDCNRIGQPNPSTCWSPVIQVHSLLHCSLHEIWCYFLRKASSYSAVLPDLCWNTCLQYVFTLHDRIKKN